MSLINKRLGDFIRLVDKKNNDNKLGIDDLYGVSVYKEFITTHANLVDVKFDNYKVVEDNQFTYIPDTSRRGDKIAIALNKFGKSILVSSVYTVFEVINPQELLPDYLMLLFMSPEYDRYARYNSWGTAREVFSWEDFCNTLFPIPDIKIQNDVVKKYKYIDKRIDNNNLIIQQLEKLSKTIFDYFFKEYKCLDNPVLKWNDKIKKNIPEHWNVKALTDIAKWIGGKQPPKEEFIYEEKEGYIRFIQNRDYSSDLYLTYIPDNKTNKTCNKFDIMIDKYGDAGKTRFGIEGAYNVALAKIEPLLSNYQEYIRCFLNDEDVYLYLNETSIASTRASLSEKNIASLNIIIPDSESLERFEHINKNIIKYLLCLKQENSLLEKLKKILIPF